MLDGAQDPAHGLWTIGQVTAGGERQLGQRRACALIQPFPSLHGVAWHGGRGMACARSPTPSLKRKGSLRSRDESNLEPSSSVPT